VKAIQVGQLKSDFSSILQQIQNEGKTFVIEYGKKHKKVAMLIPYDKQLEESAQRTFGLLMDKGNFTIHDDFSLTDDEFMGS
jgi:hypothetical protein